MRPPRRYNAPSALKNAHRRIKHTAVHGRTGCLFLFPLFPFLFSPFFFSSSGSFLKRQDCVICIISGDETEDFSRTCYVIITRRRTKRVNRYLRKMQSAALVRHALVIKYSFVGNIFKCCYKFTENFEDSFERKTVWTVIFFVRMKNCSFSDGSYTVSLKFSIVKLSCIRRKLVIWNRSENKYCHAKLHLKFFSLPKPSNNILFSN